MSFKELKIVLVKVTPWPQLISEFLVMPACLHAVSDSDWPRTFFYPKVFLFSISLFVNKYYYFVEA